MVPDRDAGALVWVAAGNVADLVFAPGAVVQAGPHELAVFRHAGGYRALLNSCPHAGGALAEGCIDGGLVACPWHGWRFDLESGACATVPADATRAFPAREVDGRLEIGLQPGEAAARG